MSVKIRLKKIGRKKQPTFRIVVTESRNPRSGKIIENVGFYCPYLKDKPLELDLDRIDAWTGKGAIVTDAVMKLVRRKRLGEGPRAVAAEPIPVVEVKPAETVFQVEPSEESTMSDDSTEEEVETEPAG